MAWISQVAINTCENSILDSVINTADYISIVETSNNSLTVLFTWVIIKQSVSLNSTGFVNPNFITGIVPPDHSLFVDDDRSTGRTWALAFKSSINKRYVIIIITMDCNIYM